VEYSIQTRKGSKVGKLITPCPSVEVSLGRYDLYKLEGDSRGVRIKGLEGCAWITQIGDPDDHMVKAGQVFQVDRPGIVIIQGMPAGRVRVQPRGR
jgi:hypothetical protein